VIAGLTVELVVVGRLVDVVELVVVVVVGLDVCLVVVGDDEDAELERRLVVKVDRIVVALLTPKIHEYQQTDIRLPHYNHASIDQ